MISIVIPTYEQQGHGAKLLEQLLQSIRDQKITVEYEIQISDSAKDGSIKAVCDQFPDLPITYNISPVYGASVNINNALGLARYDKVKIMCQDDLFCHPKAIDLFCKSLDQHGWVISNSKHVNGAGVLTGGRRAQYIHGKFDENTVGMPSVVAFRKTDTRFLPGLRTVCDMYFYHQLYEQYGQPAVIQEQTVSQRYHNASLSRNQVNQHTKEVNWLIRSGRIAGTLPSVVVCVVFHDRIENIRHWVDFWHTFKPDAELVIIHNDNGVDYTHEIFGARYIRRINPAGFDIGAMQWWFKQPDQWDICLWCTDDTVPVAPDFIEQFVDQFDAKTGVVCMHLSTEIKPHIRTTGFAIRLELSQRLAFPVPLITRQHCLMFE